MQLVSLKAIARARHWYEQITTGQARTNAQLAGLHGVSPRFIRMHMKLVQLGPQAIETMMPRPHSLPLSLTDLLVALPMNWSERHVSFVSVTQQFNTTSSMGRLTLNVLLSFAQFEREVTGERIRDKIAASKKKGTRMGGTVPLGYTARDRKLVVNKLEAATVCTIFDEFLRLDSVQQLQQWLRENTIKSRSGNHFFPWCALYDP